MQLSTNVNDDLLVWVDVIKQAIQDASTTELTIENQQVINERQLLLLLIILTSIV